MVHSTSGPSPPTSASKRPRGILKNSTSFQGDSLPEEAVASPTNTEHTTNPFAPPGERPGMSREMSEKEIVQMNTEINAGNGQRRNSSNPRGSASRRQSTTEMPDAGTSAKLQWDEANLYHNEGQMGGRMKIDEPKTPYVQGIAADEEEESEPENIDTEGLVVDELDKANAGGSSETKPKKKMREEDIPGLDLGEPEQEQMMGRRPSDGEQRRVAMDPDPMDVDGGAFHGGDEELANMAPEEREKHKRFEEMRKKHYAMKNMKGLLGHDADELE